MRLLLLLAACSDPAEDPELVALRTASDGECPSCRVFAARKAAPDDIYAAMDHCQAIEELPWKDECWFLLSDTVDARDKLATDLCGRAGHYEGQCLAHASYREGKEMLEVPGQEMETLAHVEARIEKKRPDIAYGRAREFVIKQISGRPKPIDCGNATEELCRVARDFNVHRP